MFHARFRLLQTTLAVSVAAVIASPALAQSSGSPEPSEEVLKYARGLSETFRYVARKAAPSVVNIRAFQEGDGRTMSRRSAPMMPDELFERFFGMPDLERRRGAPSPTPQERGGTGFIVSDDGLIITNNHVVGGADRVEVMLADDRTYDAEIIGTDPQTDVALIRIDADGLVPATIGDSDVLDVGDWVVAVGSPFGLNQTVTAGIVSATGRRLATNRIGYQDFIQTDAAINPGNSGGPLLNLRGEVIGINTAITTRTGGSLGIGFAIPSNMARYVMEELIEDGAVDRGWLGVQGQDLTPELARSFGYEGSGGALVVEVVDDSPAEASGVEAQDIIVRFNNRPVNSFNDLRNIVAMTPPGKGVPVTVFRDGKSLELVVTLGNRDDAQLAAEQTGEYEVEEFGMTVETLTADIAEQLGYQNPQNISGVVVTEVRRGGLAARAGIRPGDIIAELGSETIENISEFRETIESFDLSRGVRMQIIRQGVRRFLFIRA